MSSGSSVARSNLERHVAWCLPGRFHRDLRIRLCRFALYEAGLLEHTGRHHDLAQRRGGDRAALRPRRSRFHKLGLELGQPGRLVDLCELSVDVETLLDQFDFTDGRRFFGDHCSIWARRFTRAARLFAGTFGARSAVR
jgi:hypothetical protein